MNGRKITTIKKKYKRVKLPLLLRSEGEGLLAIQKLEIDKYGRIWIASAEDNGINIIDNKIEDNSTIYQLFSNTGIYLNKIDLGTDDYTILNVYFKKELMFVETFYKQEEKFRTLVFNY